MIPLPAPAFGRRTSNASIGAGGPHVHCQKIQGRRQPDPGDDRRLRPSLRAQADMMPSREDCAGLDRRDPLKGIRTRFRRPKGLLYFDGNSLGMLSQPVLRRAMETIEEEWGEG